MKTAAVRLITVFLVALSVVLTSCDDNNEIRYVEIENRSGESVLAYASTDYAPKGVVSDSRLETMVDNALNGDGSLMIDAGETARFEWNGDDIYVSEAVVIGVFRRPTLLKYDREELVKRGFDKMWVTTIFQLRADDYKIIYYGD